MQTLIVAIAGRLFEVLLKVLLIPQIKEWRDKKRAEADNKRLEEENKKKGEAYETASPANSHDEFSKLP